MSKIVKLKKSYINIRKIKRNFSTRELVDSLTFNMCASISSLKYLEYLSWLMYKIIVLHCKVHSPYTIGMSRNTSSYYRVCRMKKNLQTETIIKAPGLLTYVFIYMYNVFIILFKTKLSDFFGKRNVTLYFLMFLELVKH